MLLLKRRDTAPDTILYPLEPCRAHQKYNEQTLKKKINTKNTGQNKFRSQVCQLQAKGIWQTKSTTDANQAAKHMLLQKANVNLQGYSTLQEINPEQVSREDHFHLYSYISQDLFSQVNTHQQGLKSHARAATYCLVANAAEAGVLPSHTAEESVPEPCLGAQLDPKRKTPEGSCRGHVLQKQWDSRDFC